MTAWRFLLVEDRNDIATQVQQAGPALVAEPDTVTIERCDTFQAALDRLENASFDLLILDLKDDAASSADDDDVSAGLAVFDRLRKIRFSPVVFYTAHAHQVRQLVNPFVRVVEKTEGIEKLATEVQVALRSGLPQLSKLIDEIQRQYMWDFVFSHWREFDGDHHKADITYLLARRLASALEKHATTMARTVAGDDGQPSKESDAHPMQLYVYPTSETLQSGDLLKGVLHDIDATWIVLTPTCDFAQKKVDRVLVARCIPLLETKEYKAWNATPTGATDRLLRDLVGDNRKSIDGKEKVQPERFKYLPGTFFLDDAVVDFQDIVSVSVAEIAKLSRVASLDSPFAESLLARFARYYGRLGTPDISKDAVLERLKARLPKK